MGRTLKVHLTNARPDLVHEFRNFGEEIWRALREGYGVSLEEIDASTSEFHLREIPKREVRTVTAQVRKLVEGYRNLVIKVDEIREVDDMRGSEHAELGSVRPIDQNHHQNQPHP